ncbi:MAG: chemotaxis protein CheW, partial [Leptospirales bacterium]|nr:chemotaxis protein CheW [Leptospirales bacterium]
GLNDLSDLAHRMENLLQGIRDKTNSITQEIVDVIFKCFDSINEVIDLASRGQQAPPFLQSLSELINLANENSKINQNGGSDLTTKSDKSVNISTIKTTIKTTFSSSESKDIVNLLKKGLSCYEITIVIEEAAQMKWIKGQLIAANIEKEGSIIKTIPSLEEMSSDETIAVVKFIVISDKDVMQLCRSCDIDQIEDIELRSITLVERDGKTMLKINQSILAGKDSLRAENSAANQEKNVRESYNKLLFDDSSDPDDLPETIFDRRKESRPVENDRRKAPMLKTVKVAVDKLDVLLNNVGELVIANSGFYRIYDDLRRISPLKTLATEFKNRLEQMSRITKYLQEGIMKTRMVPIGQVFTRFNRLVRDLAREHGKMVDLVIRGEETELDKKVIDVIGEPLLHLIRNAVDHGIESPEERAGLGKPEKATVLLNAYQGGNQIFVEIEDDGKGLNLEAIKAKVLEKQLASPEVLASMDDSAIYNYIFIPGFSTAKKITDISGRGVGMNVVRETVNELNGSVNIETESGTGTKFTLAFPLTLAIMPAIMVAVRREVYAIPLSDVIETIKISNSDITSIEGHEVINLRGEILSLLRLNEFIGIKSALSVDKKVPVVVVGYGNRKIGLIVDFLEGKMEIVIKSLEQNYTNVEGLAGASILGDGSICLILDIQAMINKVITQQERLTQEERLRIIIDNVVDLEEFEMDEQKSSKTFLSDDISLDELIIEEEILSRTSGSKDLISDEENLEDAEESDSELETLAPDDLRAGNESDSKVETLTADDLKTYNESESKVETLTADDLKTYDESDSESETPIDDLKTDDESYSRSESPTHIEIDIPEDEPEEPVKDELDVNQTDGDNVEAEVKMVLSEFRDELKQNINDVISVGMPDSHITSELDISKDELNEFNLLSNMGAANAAESLSKILNKRIDLSIPEVKLTPVEKVADYFSNLDEQYMGVLLGIEGEISGTLLLLLQEKTGFELIDMLYGVEITGKKELGEDEISALKEMTNIIGSSILNVYAEKSNMLIKPNVPTFVNDYLQSIVDTVLVVQNIKHDYAIVMETAFYFEDDQIVGDLMILPDTASLKVLVNGFKCNVGTD